MDEIKLDGEEERLRLDCEHKASSFWPGARVLVHAVAGRYHAAVFLPEDGVDLDACAEPSDWRDTAREALDEVDHAIGRMRSLDHPS
jgi:hypothetical protein